MKKTKKNVADFLLNIPEETAWLIDFANLGLKKVGEYNPQFGSKITEEADKRKRKSKLDENNLIPNYTNIPDVDVDKQGKIWHEWGNVLLGTTTFLRFSGKELFPLQEFKDWILKVGIPPTKPDKIIVKEIGGAKPYELNLKNKNKEEKKVQEILAGWQSMIRSTMLWIAEGRKTHLNPPELLWSNIDRPLGLLAPRVDFCHQEPKFESHPATLPEAAWAYLLDLWVNRKKLCERLTVCPTCGRFFFKKGKMVYCCTKCKDRFNLITRESDAKRKRDGRIFQKEKLRSREEIKERWFKEEEKKYRDYFNALGYSQEATEGVIDNMLYGEGLSFEQGLKEYQWGKRR